MCVYAIACLFFFQAEDGIRYLVRSRGLGDVYKRQVSYSTVIQSVAAVLVIVRYSKLARARFLAVALAPVSYTHLTLPTSDLV